ncbi:MAG TPA: hypothetical protein PKH02_00385 [Bacteroidales bacterium]|nr:hypothetical protein [Bacteroidales bacterium]
MEGLCKNYEKCPIYNGILKDKAMTSGFYKKQYCEAGEKGWITCKRFMVKEATGKCPPDLLPNSFKSIEDIVKEMNPS